MALLTDTENKIADMVAFGIDLNEISAKLSLTPEKTREHNDSNFIAFGGRVDYKDDVLKMLDAFLDTPFSHDERHQRRIDKMMELQGK